MKKPFAFLIAFALLFSAATAFAEGYQVITDTGGDELVEDGVTIAVLDAEFPQIVGLADTAVMDRVNRAIQDYIRLEGGYDAVCESALSDFKQGAEWFDFSKYHYDLTVRAESPLHTDRLFSVFYQLSAYTGGAHPGHWGAVQHFDLKTGDPVYLEALVDDTDAFHAHVADLLLKEMADSGMAAENYFFDDYEEAVRAWPLEQAVLAGDGLTVFFNEYDVAPYASGAQSATIPYAALDGYWNDAGRALLGR